MPTVQTYEGKRGVTYRVRGRDAFGRPTTETFHTKKAAETFCKLVDATSFPEAQADRARRDQAAGEYMPTLAEWLPKHIELLTGVDDRTRVDYASMAARTFLPFLGAMPLDAIERPAVAKMINGLEKKGLAAKSIKNAHGLLSSVMASAIAERHIDWNPCYKMRLPRAGEHEKRDERFLTHLEYERLVAVFPPAYLPLLVTLFGTGLRWGEASALTASDYKAATAPDVHNALGMPATFQVTKAWKYDPGKGWKIGPPKSLKSRRSVMLPTQVTELVQPLLVDKAPGDLLFTAPKGGPLQHSHWRTRVWVPACIAAGLATPRPDRHTDPKGWKAWNYDGPRIHDARHTHASWLMEQPLVTLEMVQDQLGHESILTTRKVYGHLQPAMRNALAAAATRAMATTVLQGPPLGATAALGAA